MARDWRCDSASFWFGIEHVDIDVDANADADAHDAKPCSHCSSLSACTEKTSISMCVDGSKGNLPEVVCRFALVIHLRNCTLGRMFRMLSSTKAVRENENEVHTLVQKETTKKHKVRFRP